MPNPSSRFPNWRIGVLIVVVVGLFSLLAIRLGHLQVMRHGHYIQVAEARLQAFGYDPGPVDGVLTAETEAALRAFQRRYGLTVTGLLDRETRRELVPGLDPVRRQ
jgi:peptidoglycan hydrolase-like protein with peptidoglycan-binding domain